MELAKVTGYAAALGLVGMVTSGCSLVLDWDINNQLCAETEPTCKDTYSCLDDRCVKDQTVSTGETCSRDEQCEIGNICVRGPRLCPGNVACTADPLPVCRKICDVRHAYQDSSDCLTGYYCRPSPDPTNSQQLRGACVESDCDMDNLGQCSPRQVCVMVREQAGVCFTPCDNTFAADGTLADDCPATTAATCQPVGLPGAEIMVCIDPSTTQQPATLQCDLANHTCLSGTACISGICTRLCNTSTGAPCCSTGSCVDQCIPVTSSTPPYAVCTGD